MPSAEELREISRHKNALEIFLDMATIEVRSAANHGETHIMIEIPPSIKTIDALSGLKRTFPGCIICKNWFSPHVKIKWD